MVRLAHISDVHFATITYNPKQFLSKRWLGNCNLILFRHKTHLTNHLFSLPALFASLHVDAVALTGDLTTTSLDDEFIKAKSFIQALSLPTFLLPGNHDIYTKESEKAARFYHYFPEKSELSKVSLHKIKEGFYWVGLDCAYASNLFLSNGIFTPQHEKNLRATLESIPKEATIVLGNHFPLLGHNNPRHDLKGAKKLQALLKSYPNIRLYLHGHDHHPYVIDKRSEGLPLIFNCGSASHLPAGNFYLLDLTEKECHWQRYSAQKESWQKVEEKTFIF